VKNGKMILIILRMNCRFSMNHFNPIKGNITISVCVATFKRELQLENLLKSLQTQEIPSNLFLEIVIVDNDSRGSGEKIFDKFNDSKKIVFKYFLQPEKNISISRNLAVQQARGDYICFIDDDETASINWIQNFFIALHLYKVDGAFGYVKPIFDENIPLYLRKREYYFNPIGKTGTEAKYYYTTNAIINSKIIKSERVPFNPEYGLTGGEDAHLFERLAKKGAKYINCKEAITFEFIPRDRGTTSYIYKRALQGGQSFVRRRLENKRIFFSRLFILIKACIIICLSIIQLAVGFVSKKIRVKGIIKFGASRGKIIALFGNYKKMY